MQRTYKTLGDYIQLVDERNKGLSVKQLLGLSISKQFIPSVANIVGTDMENYKIIRKNQFACSTMQVRRDKKMPVALLQIYDEAIISQAYPVFEVKDEKVLLPEYLMMWFSREEFDREACFHAVGGVRGSLEWEDFCNMKFPLPSPEKQREIVAEYNTVKNRIELNNQLIQKLEETAQAIYKQWFVEFEFPDENGNPYKSSGGNMVYNEELDKEIPEGWEVKTLNLTCDVINGRAYAETEFREKGTPVIRIQNLNGGKKYVFSDFELDEDKYVEKDDLIFAWSATFGPFIWRGEKSIYHYHIWKMIPHKKEFKFLLYHYFMRETKRVSGEGTGSIFAHITKSLMESQLITIPDTGLLKQFHKIALAIDITIANTQKEKENLLVLNETLLSKVATIKN